MNEKRVEEVCLLLCELDSIATQISFSSLETRFQAYRQWVERNGLSQANVAIASFLNAVNLDGVEENDL